jgi:transcriptional regulator with XRE-family HTH domain
MALTASTNATFGPVKKDAALTQLQCDIGQRIREARERAALTQEDAAAAAGIDYKRWQRLELGQVNATVKTLHRVAEALGTDFWSLLAPPPAQRTK